MTPSRNPESRATITEVLDNAIESLARNYHERLVRHGMSQDVPYDQVGDECKRSLRESAETALAYFLPLCITLVVEERRDCLAKIRRARQQAKGCESVLDALLAEVKKSPTLMKLREIVESE